MGKIKIEVWLKKNRFVLWLGIWFVITTELMGETAAAGIVLENMRRS